MIGGWGEVGEGMGLCKQGRGCRFRDGAPVGDTALNGEEVLKAVGADPQGFNHGGIWQLSRACKRARVCCGMSWLVNGRAVVRAYG